MAEYGPAASAVAPVAAKGAAVKAKAPVVAPVVAAVEEDDDDLDLFGSEDEAENAENEKLKAARVAEYNAKKAAGSK